MLSYVHGFRASLPVYVRAVVPHLRLALGASLVFLSSLCVVHGAMPFPYSDSVIAEIAVGSVVALLIYGCASEEADSNRSGRLVAVCIPLLLAGVATDSDERPIALMGALFISALIRPRFWTGEERVAAPAFRASLLGVTLLQGLHLVWVGSTAETSYDADAFYYFGLARHWVLEGRVEDHVVWHFLAPPEEVVHPIGDYWQPMTSIVVAPWLRLFGATHSVAGAAAAGFSLLGGIALWHLVTARGIVKHRAVQLAIVVAYGCNPQLERFRIDAETQGVMATICLLTMVAMSHRRWGLAIVLASGLAFTRSDASVAALALVACTCLAARPDERPRVAAFVLAVGAFYVTSHLLRFGTLGPPAAARAPLLATYQDLYRYRPQLLSGGERVASVLAALVTSPLGAAAVLLQHPFVMLPGAGLYASYAGFGAWSRDARSDAPQRAVVASSIVLSLFVPMVLVAIAGPVFNDGRTFQGLIGAMHVTTAYAVDRLLTPRRIPPTLSALIGLLFAGLALSLVTLAQPRTSQRLELSRELRQLSSELGGHVVLTELSWWVGAETDADGVIHTPIGNEAEVVEVIERWQPDLFLAEPRSCPASVSGAIPGDSFQEGQLGEYRLVPLRRGNWFRLYRIERQAGPETANVP